MHSISFGLHLLHKAEVADFDLALRVEEKALRLDIAVGDALLPQVTECRQSLFKDAPQLCFSVPTQTLCALD